MGLFEELGKTAATAAGTVFSSGSQPLSGIGGALGGISSGGAYDALFSRYRGFAAPEAAVEISGEPIGRGKKDAAGLMTDQIEVELTAGFEASSARFRIYQVFDAEKAVFRDKAFGGLAALGAPLSVKLGYLGCTVEVFSGFIAGISYLYEEGGAPCVEITGMDAKGAMMAGRSAVQLKGRHYSDCVKEILQKPNYAALFRRCEIDGTPDGGASARWQTGLALPDLSGAAGGAAQKDGKTIEMVNESDYEFVVKAAKKFGYEFFSCADTLYFRRPKSIPDALMRLKFGQGLLSCELGASLTGLAAQVEARGADVGKGALISAKSKVRYKVPAPAGSILSQSRRVIADPTIRSREDAAQRAEAVAEQMLYRYGSFQAECIGIPELVPGRFLELAALNDSITTCYLTEVRHLFSADGGFRTKITAKAAAL